MADAVTVVPRQLVAEDFSTNATFSQVTMTIMGLGPTTVTPIVSAASDAAAAAAGVPVGALYLNTGGSFNYLATRMS